jgi:hypothetical protein
LCAQKCKATTGCLAFEVFENESCWIFVDKLKLPFNPYPGCLTCVRNLIDASAVEAAASAAAVPPASVTYPNTVSGFQLGNGTLAGTFVLNGAPIRLFAGSLQHFRIHPDHWGHRLAMACRLCYLFC